MALAEVITGDEDGDGIPNPQLVGESLKEDYDRMVLSIETQLELNKAAVQTAMTKEQHEELKEGVKELSDLLLEQLKEAYINLKKALPQDVDRLKRGHEEFYAQKIPELDKLRMD